MKTIYTEAAAIFKELTGKKDGHFSTDDWEEIHKIVGSIIIREDMKAKNQVAIDAQTLMGINFKNTMDDLFKKLGGLGGMGSVG